MGMSEGVFRIFKRAPDVVIGGAEDPYLLRWHIIPRNRFFNIYLHKFLRDDDDRALHDHPWASLSLVLKGSYIEHLPDRFRVFRRGAVIWRGPKFRHRIELFKQIVGYSAAAPWRIVRAKPVWTLFITGPRVREWGFWCPDAAAGRERFVPWHEFTDPDDPGQTGKGCG